MFARSLTGKLSMAFTGFGLGVILLAGAFGIWNTTDEFHRREFQQRDLPELARRLAVYYEDHDESWGSQHEDLPLPPHAMLLDMDQQPVSARRKLPVAKRDWLRRNVGDVAITKNGKIVGFLRVQKLPPVWNVNDVAGMVRSPLSWLGFGAILLTAGISGTFMSRRMTRPLLELTEATQAVAAGDLEYRVPVHSQDEFGTLAKAFNSMNEQLKTSQQQKRRMTQDIVHDLAQPVLVIRGLAESMQEGMIPKSEESLQVIRQEADRLDTLIRNLHFLEQADSRRLQLNRAFVAPSDLLARFRTMYQEPARRAGIDLQVTGAADLPMVYVDAERFIQVLSNLAANAFQHGAAGDTVTLTAATHEQEVRFTLTDNGPGVPEADLPRIFDRFYRADEARSPGRGGSGIGLAIVKSLMEAQGGRVWAESAQPHGLCIVMSLPVDSEVPFVDDPENPPDSRAQGQPRFS